MAHIASPPGKLLEGAVAVVSQESSLEVIDITLSILPPAHWSGRMGKASIEAYFLSGSLWKLRRSWILPFALRNGSAWIGAVNHSVLLPARATVVLSLGCPRRRARKEWIRMRLYRRCTRRTRCRA